jgi:hypothetical protein
LHHSLDTTNYLPIQDSNNWSDYDLANKKEQNIEQAYWAEESTYLKFNKKIKLLEKENPSTAMKTQTRKLKI